MDILLKTKNDLKAMSLYLYKSLVSSNIGFSSNEAKFTVSEILRDVANEFYQSEENVTLEYFRVLIEKTDNPSIKLGLERVFDDLKSFIEKIRSGDVKYEENSNTIKEHE